MVKLISHASLLKNDDVRLKSMPMYSRFCGDCDLADVDDVKHLMLQCPKWQDDRTEMLNMIENIPDGSGQRLLNAQGDLTLALLGKIDDRLMFEQSIEILKISARYISKTYNDKIKQGIG